MADGRQKNGGKRTGAGRKPSLRPLAAVRLRDPDLRAKLAAVTRHEREVSHDPTISQEQLVAMLIEEAHREMLAFQALPSIDSVANQCSATAMIDYPNNQSRGTNRPAVATMAYQLVITIKDVTLRIWRRLVVTSDTTLAQLHTYLQIAFEWDDYHLHEFQLHGAVCDDDMRLDQLYLQSGYGLDYIYDLLRHEVVDMAVEPSNGNSTWCSVTSTLPERAMGVIPWYEAFGTMYPVQSDSMAL